MKIEFQDGKVRLDGKEWYSCDECGFTILPFTSGSGFPVCSPSDCASCSLCRGQTAMKIWEENRMYGYAIIYSRKKRKKMTGGGHLFLPHFLDSFAQNEPGNLFDMLQLYDRGLCWINKLIPEKVYALGKSHKEKEFFMYFCCRSPRGERGLKSYVQALLLARYTSLPARGAWIRQTGRTVV